jgi:hypothetical protein
MGKCNFPRLPSGELGGRPAYDLHGRTFGRLTVLGLGDPDGPVLWRCRCACGSECEKPGNYLLSRDTKVHSCGCAPQGRPLGWRKPSPTWPADLRYEDSPEAIKDKGSPKPRQPKPEGRPPAACQTIVMVDSAPRYIARLAEAELIEAARLNAAQACKVRRERKRRDAVEAARCPPGRPCQDPEREAARVARWREAGCPKSWLTGRERVARPKPAPWVPQFQRIDDSCDRYPELRMPARLALVQQYARRERHAA